ncbi:MAG: sugar phosphate isomerase/epimerase [Desulfurococcales archaeon]|nr:sugar phosphate isomerase/epimerase [Desulfurococcales archaeon]
MILFDWGTYNGLSKLRIAATLGMKLTEIPPYDFSRRGREESYFSEYRSYAEKAFTTITAHAPYYNVVSVDRSVMERSWNALIAAAKMARLAGARIFNLHLGWRAYLDNRDLEYAIEFLKKLAGEIGDSMIVSVEVPYTRRMLGDWDEIRAMREEVGEEKLIVSVQLENVWMYETQVSETGAFEQADKETGEDYWRSVLGKTLKLSTNYLSLRYSQVIGFALGRRILKKRVPLGKGYPSLEPLARALAEFMVKEVRGKGVPLNMHVIYTGPPDTKYHDTLALYTTIMREAIRHL